MKTTSRRDATRRRWIFAGVGLAAAAAAVGLLLLPTGGRGSAGRSAGAAAGALARLADRGGDPYVGTIGDVTDPVTLLRRLRTEFRSSASAAAPSHDAAPARACARQLRASGSARGEPVVLLADAVADGSPAVVVAVADRGRVVAFVVDRMTCEVRAAQSL